MKERDSLTHLFFVWGFEFEIEIMKKFCAVHIIGHLFSKLDFNTHFGIINWGITHLHIQYSSTLRLVVYSIFPTWVDTHNPENVPTDGTSQELFPSFPDFPCSRVMILNGPGPVLHPSLLEFAISLS